MINYIDIAAPAAASEGLGSLFGTIGSGGIALILTAVLYFGIKEPKSKGGGGPKGKGGGGGGGGAKVRHRLECDPAFWVGYSAGVFYTTAGNIWVHAGEASVSVSKLLTHDTFGDAGLGVAAALPVVYMYYRKPRVGVAALMGIFCATAWARAGGIWSLPQTLVEAAAQAIGLAG
ncbi:hypothetical protein [Streptomyces sp. NPDC015125]|uniref:hypothetical protein n=1 Tax=Streptomyces sp. NPDC015125 TaxID=3364938 RepID=UPI0036F83FFD